MITAQDLSFSFGPKQILDSAYFSIGKNIKVGLVGPNGAGKSTLFKLISGEIKPDFGSIQSLGTVVTVPQEVKADPIMDDSPTIRDYLDPGNDHFDYQIEQILSGLELDHIDLIQSPKNLSGGQRTKLALARSLLLQPDILLLDEPTNFLDIKGKRWVMDFFKRLS